VEIEVLKESKDCLEFLVNGEKHTFPNLLRAALLKDSRVKFAAYKLKHPSDNGAMFVVRAEGKTPKKALADALKRIGADLSDFEKDVKKALK